MPQTLPALEGERSRWLEDISKLGDFRSGSITSVVRRCGKPNCHCARPQGAGHGPDFRLTYKVNGKTRTESLPTPAARHKAEREVAEFRKFQQLSRTLVETNAAICRLRAVEEEPETEPEKKQRKRSDRRSPAK
ncbi:MAG TPA: DUF6788 family protein [Terriglobia bacterium]